MIFLFFRATVVDVRVGALDEDKVVAAFFEDMVVWASYLDVVASASVAEVVFDSFAIFTSNILG